MNTIDKDTAFEKMIHKIDPQARLLRTWALTGGVSAQVTAVAFERSDGQPQTVVIRQHGAVDLAQNPRVARDEYQLLNILYTGGMNVPQPFFADESGEILPTPYVVIAFVEGKTLFETDDLDGYITQAAGQLAKLHTTNWPNVSVLPAQTYANWFRERPAKMDDSLGEGGIRDVLEKAWPLLSYNPTSLLHGDYWPGNLIWKDGQLAAVIDWEDAHLGDPLQDLAIARLDLLWAFGSKAMEQFTTAYQQMTTLDYRNLPYWDLCAALRPAGKLSSWMTDAGASKVMRDKHAGFVAQAMAKISKG